MIEQIIKKLMCEILANTSFNRLDMYQNNKKAMHSFLKSKV